MAGRCWDYRECSRYLSGYVNVQVSLPGSLNKEDHNKSNWNSTSMSTFHIPVLENGSIIYTSLHQYIIYTKPLASYFTYNDSQPPLPNPPHNPKILPPLHLPVPPFLLLPPQHPSRHRTRRISPQMCPVINGNDLFPPPHHKNICAHHQREQHERRD